MKRRIGVKDLRLGMFVSELDRPWLETPFLFQGFLIETPDELGAVQDVCEYVYVDETRSLGERDLDAVQAPGTDPDRFATDYEDVVQGIAPARRGLIKMIDDRRLGRLVETDPLKEAVATLLNGVLGHPEAALWLTRIREADELTATHSLNVAVLSMAFAHHLRMPAEKLEAIGLGALLHDIGLTEMARAILRKKDALTDEEFAIVRRHPEQGLAGIRDADVLPEVTRDIVRWHHERLDGSGYPDGLPAARIPQHVSVVALADSYDALVSDRVYRKGAPPADALLELSKKADRTFGASLVRAFIRCIGIYPPGTVVRLSTGAVGVVMASRHETRLQPLVMLLRDAEGSTLHPRHLVDLSHVEQKTGKRWTIEQAVDPAEYNLDIAAILRDEKI